MAGQGHAGDVEFLADHERQHAKQHSARDGPPDLICHRCISLDAPAVAFAVRAMLGRIRGQRQATKEDEYAEADDTEAERQSDPLKDIGHPKPWLLLEFGRGGQEIGSSRRFPIDLELKAIRKDH